MAAPYEGFARRLHQALDHVGFDRGRSRTGKLANHYDVSRETARKWLSGLAMPEFDRMIALADHANVYLEWLATGRGEMTGSNLRVRETALPYLDREMAQIVGVIRQLSAARRRALLVLLEGATEKGE